MSNPMKALVGLGVAGVGSLIFVHGIVPEHFLVDSTTVALVILLGLIVGLPFLPTIRRYISELTVMGTTIKFREEIERAEQLAETVAEEAEARPPAGAHDEGGGQRADAEKVEVDSPRFVNVPDHLYRLIEEDAKLAVAGLGIELERVLRGAAERAGVKDSDRMALGRLLPSLTRRELIDRNQQNLLRQ